MPFFPRRLGVAAQQQSLPCLQPTPQATQCTIPDVHLFSTVPYVLNVTAVHPGGASSSLLAFVAERISECPSSPALAVPLSCRGPRRVARPLLQPHWPPQHPRLHPAHSVCMT